MDSRVGKIPWRRERLPTPVFWPGEFHGLYRPWGRKESDTTERLSLSLHFTSAFMLKSPIVTRAALKRLTLNRKLNSAWMTGESDLGVKKAHGWFNMMMSSTAACLCGGGREKGLKEPMAVREGLYQPFSEAWQDRGERKRQPPHLNFSSENAVSSEETGKMKEHS